MYQAMGGYPPKCTDGKPIHKLTGDSTYKHTQMTAIIYSLKYL
jgi:hypothetical protein